MENERVTVLKYMEDVDSADRQLVKRVNVLSMEDGGLLGAGIDVFLNSLKDISNFFNDVGDDIVEKLKKSPDYITVKEFKKLELEIKRYAPHADLIKADELEFPVTVGQSVNFVDMNKYLIDNLKIIDNDVLPAIKELDITLSKILTDADYRKSFRPKAKLTKKAEELNKTIIENTREVIAAEKPMDRMLGQQYLSPAHIIIKSNTELIECLSDLNEKDFIKFKSIVDNIPTKVDYLIKSMKNNEDFVISKNTLTDLSYLLEVNAKLITNAMSVLILLRHQADSMDLMSDVFKNIK